MPVAPRTGLYAGGLCYFAAMLLVVMLASPAVAATSYEYDELNRLVRVVHDDGTLTTFTYDAAGNILSRVDDGCPLNPQKLEPGQCGCDTPDTDSDGDSRCDCVDNCVTIANPVQEDADRDGIGDLCDNCPGVSNFSQSDFDRDGRGDRCDDDDDNDGYPDAEDDFPFDASEWLDTDDDGLGDNLEQRIGTSVSEADTDGDGFSDLEEYELGSDPRNERDIPIQRGLSPALLRAAICSAQPAHAMCNSR